MKAKLLLIIMCLFASYAVHAYHTNSPETNIETILATCNYSVRESSCIEDIATSYFITTWTSSGSLDRSITIPTIGTGYNYDVDWDNDGVFDVIGVTGDATHDYRVEGEFIVTIRGDFPRIYFGNRGDRYKILSVEQWGTGTWTSMEQAFSGCSNLIINALDNPDLSNVTSMYRMFFKASSLNQDIGAWDVSNVTNMVHMFYYAINFNQDLSAWNVSNVTSMNSMFLNAFSFNQDISTWDVSSVKDMYGFFFNATSFNQDISAWDVSSVTDLSYMFYYAINFNQDLSNWDVSSVTNMSDMFSNASSFNQDISNWDVSIVINMSKVFSRAYSFNQDISAWDVSNVIHMSGLFREATSFNQDISAWDVSSVSNMTQMFNNATSFNQDISTWDVSNVNYMSAMFASASSFNQDLSIWDVSSATSMSQMFQNATSFNQDLGAWDVSSVTTMINMFNLTTLSSANYDNTLIGWSTLDFGETQIPENIIFNGGNSNYCYGASARANLIDTHGWTIADGGLDCSTLHINEEIFQELSVYPNPVKSNVTIILQDSASYSLFDIQGKVVDKGELFLGINTLNLEHISNGFYILKLKTGNHSTIKKIIKE